MAINERDLRTDATLAAVELLKTTPCEHHPRDQMVIDCEACTAEAMEGYRAGTWPSADPTLREKIGAALAQAPLCSTSSHDRHVPRRGDCSDCANQGLSTEAESTLGIIKRVLAEEGIEIE